MDKVKDNKLSSLKSFFFKELEEKFSKREIQLNFEYCCECWLGFTKSDLIINANTELSESEILLFLYGIKDLIKDRPVQYITGKSFFYGLEFFVEEGVLIPRPETEELVDMVIKESKGVSSLLDVGTGSGCIPLALKKHLQDCKVLSMDVSDKALSVAERNAKQLQLDVTFHRGNALEKKEWPKEKFDVIVSNPPYITESEKERMESNVLEFEPELALFVPNDDPLRFYKAIAEIGKEVLNDCGKIYFEINENFGEKLCNLLFDLGYFVTLHKDLQGKDRIVKAVLGDG